MIQSKLTILNIKECPPLQLRPRWIYYNLYDWKYPMFHPFTNLDIWRGTCAVTNTLQARGIIYVCHQRNASGLDSWEPFSFFKALAFKFTWKWDVHICISMYSQMRPVLSLNVACSHRFCSYTMKTFAKLRTFNMLYDGKTANAWPTSIYSMKEVLNPGVYTQWTKSSTSFHSNIRRIYYNARTHILVSSKRYSPLDPVAIVLLKCTMYCFVHHWHSFCKQSRPQRKTSQAWRAQYGGGSYFTYKRHWILQFPFFLSLFHWQ